MDHVIRHLHHLRLYTKLLLSYFIIVLIPLTVWSITSYYQSNQLLRTKAEADTHNTFLSVQSTLNNKIIRAERSINLVADDANVIEIVNTTFISNYQKAQNIRERFDPFILSVSEQNEYLEQIIIYTYNNLINIRAYIRDASAVTAKEEVERLSSRGNPLWVLSGNTLSLSRKSINVSDPNKSATISFIIKTPVFFENCVPKQSLNYRLTVRDENDQLIYVQSSENNSDEFEKNTKNILTESARIDHAGWSVELKTDISPMMQSPFSNSGGILLAIGMSLLILLVVVWKFSHSFSSRINQLKKQLDAVVTSEYNADISSPFSDEIGDITNAVGDMVRQTRKMILEVYQGKIAQRDAQISALQAQINPHFLYNTLSNLNWRSIVNEDIETSNILTALSRFYRLSLNNGKSITTVEQELKHVQTYIQIQTAIHRCPDFDVRYEVDEELLEYNMPGIILQPIVENALEHGIGAIGFDKGVLRISILKENENIIIKIADNGPGMDRMIAEKILDLNDDSIGYGLKNVYKRLKLFFDNQCSLSFEETEYGGNTVIVRIPPYIQT